MKIIQIVFYFTFTAKIITGKKYLVETSGDTVKDHKTGKDTEPAATATPLFNDYGRQKPQKRMAGTGFWDTDFVRNVYPLRYG